jgi:uncharacterized protein involved in exopolysaccharide biosynthesis
MTQGTWQPISEPQSSTDFQGPVHTPKQTDGEGTLFGALNALLRQRGIVMLCVITAAVVAGMMAATRPRTYTSVSSFMAEGRQTSASGLAAQLGFALPGTSSSESPQFYVDLLRSREILGTAVSSEFRLAGIAKSPATLIELYQAPGQSPPLRRDAAINRLDKALKLSISPKTNVITVRVSASDPVLAQQLNRRLIDLLSDFNLRRRQSRASEERRFAEGRLSAVQGELRGAEDRLQSFLQANRDYRNSPSLVFQYERLQADVALLRQLVTTLQQSAEQAKMDQVRDTPTITLVESPEAPVRPDPRGTVELMLIGAVLGAFLGIALAFLRETLARPNVRGSTDYEEFVQLRREAVQDLLHPWRALRRSAGKRTKPPLTV